MRPRNFRVKTIKLRKCISQGLILPLSLLPNNKKGYKEGDNVTEMLGITKYLTSTEKREIEKENIQDNCINKFFKRYEWYRRLLSKKRKERFPKFIRKTDETRIQNLPNVCTELENVPLYVSEKLNGSSATYALVQNKKWFGLKTKFEFIVCSRNIWLKKKDLTNNYWKIAEKYKIEEQLKELIGNRPFLILQGEMLGPGIQGNIYKLQDIDFYAFNLIENPYTFVEPLKAESILYAHGIKHVPILSTNYILKPSISECIEDTNLKSKLNNKVPIEGIVCRDYDKNISFKIINPKHLLKYDE